MGRLREIYNRNIYGVMGTLIFHILLFSAFLLADVNIKGNVKEEEIVIEFPDVIPEPEEIQEVPEMEQSAVDQGAEPTKNQNMTTNVASNRLASNESFFDQDYINEVEAAQKLVSDVNHQLSKDVVGIDDIKMPVSTTEGLNPDSLKNAVYKGESNIVYYLENRYHVSLPVPVYLAQGGGRVIVDIVVNREGEVILANVRNNSSVRDQQIYLYAKVAASRTIFNSDPDAPEQQKGTIQYTFIAQ